MPQPDVSVIVPVWNAMPYLVTCLSSLLEQTIDRGRMEVVAVDDGSTDGSGEQLDLVAACWPTLQVVHQPASGGPSRPRNVALDRASGLLQTQEGSPASRSLLFAGVRDVGVRVGQTEERPPGSRLSLFLSFQTEHAVIPCTG